MRATTLPTHLAQLARELVKLVAHGRLGACARLRLGERVLALLTRRLLEQAERAQIQALFAAVDSY